MVKQQDLFHTIPRRYRHYPYLIFLIFILCFLIYSLHSDSPSIQVEVTTTDNNSNYFDLFDDDDQFLNCPSEIQFNISNRRHLSIIVAPKLVSFLWKNFRALLCTGVNVYIMLDEVFDIKSPSRVDNFTARTNRSIRSYTHRFLHVSDKKLKKYGVNYMTKFPSTQYTSWERAVVWLYHRNYLTNVWLLDYTVQWFHVDNITYLFDLYDKDTNDILCADIVPSNVHTWLHWPRVQSDIFPKAYWTGTFSPLVRWSRRLLLHHYQYMQLIHKDRLSYELNLDFHFKDFLMGTIAAIEKLSIDLYNKNNNFIQVGLFRYSDTEILFLLRRGKYIIHPIDHDSILTKYRTEEIIQMMNRNNINISQINFIKGQKMNYINNSNYTIKLNTSVILLNNTNSYKNDTHKLS